VESRLHSLEGSTVVDVEELYDYVQLFFSNEAILSIYNRLSISPPSVAASDLKGAILTRVHETAEAVTLDSLPPMRVCVDLRPEAQVGPEAMTLGKRGEPTIVWN
jgi:hypothetical protein